MTPLVLRSSLFLFETTYIRVVKPMLLASQHCHEDGLGVMTQPSHSCEQPPPPKVSMALSLVQNLAEGVSYCYQNKLPQTSQFKTTSTYYLTVLLMRRPGKDQIGSLLRISHG